MKNKAPFWAWCRVPLATLAGVFSLCGPAAAYLSLSQDYQSMMQWLTHETVEGLAFDTGFTFDPPDEMRSWRIQPDVSFGVGVVPLDKSRFPTMTVPALAAMDPAKLLPNRVMFPDLTVHMRLGLPGRWDVSCRAVDMTVPNGYRLTPTTSGGGQSNTVGFGVRRHLLGGDLPLVTMAANYNHVFGHFDFSNRFQNLAMTPDFIVDAQNDGRLTWDVGSIGINAVVSQAFGMWTPFVGMGYNRMSGSVEGRLRSTFSSDLLLPAEGLASNVPEQNQARAIFGVQLDRSRLGLFFTGEVKASGASAGKTFIVSTGLTAPFGIGAGNAGRRSAASAQPQREAYEPLPQLELFEEPQDSSSLVIIR